MIETLPAHSRYVLITGGAGFIGANLADRLLRDGERVVLFDNLSRPGVEKNYAWLRQEHGGRVTLCKADLRGGPQLTAAVEGATAVYHFAAQVAVTTSLESPLEDFTTNALGTLHLLEALRARRDPPPLVFTSTNKVYGSLSEVPLRLRGERYEPSDATLRQQGISEQQPLAFYSPYGCSKGTADQYALDYARTFGLPATVFRMSCIYGPRQFGTEDQGWVAHFLLRALAGLPIVLYGDGHQARDILFVDDLVEAFLIARREISALSGEAFNIGGGPKNVTSLLELIQLIGEMEGAAPSVEFGDWRPGDQRYYVSDTRKFQQMTGWAPRTGVRDGVQQLRAWLKESTAPRTDALLATR